MSLATVYCKESLRVGAKLRTCAFFSSCTVSRVETSLALRVGRHPSFFSTDTTSSPRVETTIDSNGIARVSLSRPDKLNALDLRMFEAIAQEASSLKQNRSLRAVILSGQGKAFCTGLDVKTILKSNPKKTVDRLLERPSGYSSTSETTIYGNLAQDVAYLWRDLPVPVICVLHGMCYGGGFQIALGADFRYATPDCKLSIMESKWGLIPDMSCSVTLRELVRIDVAKELTMTGRVFDGREAASLGLVTECVEDPMARAQELATNIVKRYVNERERALSYWNGEGCNEYEMERMSIMKACTCLDSVILI